MKKHIKIKVCGIATEDGLEEILALQPDYLGFLCVTESPRFVSLEKARQLLDICEGRTERVLVFRNAALTELITIQRELQAEVLQLHGEEAPSYVESLRSIFPKTQLWKTISVGEGLKEADIKAYEGKGHALLFDTASTQGGGTGRSFDWTLLSKLSFSLPFFLSGGIGVDSLVALHAFRDTYPKLAEQLVGIDVNSRFEQSPGRKDPKTLQQLFCLEESRKTNPKRIDTYK